MDTAVALVEAYLRVNGYLTVTEYPVLEVSRHDEARAVTLTFAGAAGTVTGSKHLLALGGETLLLDCGLFQGLKELRQRNWAPPPFDPASLGAVVLSHGHLDHCGYLPLLVRHGYSGAVHCTPATADIVAIVLRDAARLQQEDADDANRAGYTRHAPALPLFTLDDVEQALTLLQSHAYGERFRATPSATALFRRAGHILGSASVDVELSNGAGAAPLRVVFSGDLGRWGRPILRDPEFVPEADVVLVESTYGDRLHSGDAAAQLAQVVNEAAARGGVIIVPAFAIGRTQELIWTLRQLEDAGRIPALPVFIDSPMAINVTEVYCQHPEDHDLDMTLLMDEKRCPLCCRKYHLVRDSRESRALAQRRGPLIVIAGSGMATGGRVLHHLKHRLSDARNTVLLCGYQAAGTRGRQLQDGAGNFRIHGDDIPVRAGVRIVDGLSAHADRDELLRWLRGFAQPPAHTYVVHGEPAAATALAQAVTTELKWDASVAQDGATLGLSPAPHGAI
ncbi:MAG: MBL fold metallo-hydrolase [Sinimarinibacterium sp.]|jgi:metallo-beta-lactamase family protein